MNSIVVVVASVVVAAAAAAFLVVVIVVALVRLIVQPPLLHVVALAGLDVLPWTTWASWVESPDWLVVSFSPSFLLGRVPVLLLPSLRLPI